MYACLYEELILKYIMFIVFSNSFLSLFVIILECMMDVQVVHYVSLTLFILCIYCLSSITGIRQLLYLYQASISTAALTVIIDCIHILVLVSVYNSLPNIITGSSAHYFV